MPRLIPVPRRRSGFTLPEMLVTLLLMSVVGGAIFKTIMKQQQAHRDTVRQAGMQRELRLAGSFLPSEMRSASSAGGDVQEMQENLFQFNATIGSSIVCKRDGARRIIIPPENMAELTLTNWYIQPQLGDSVFIYDEGAQMGSEDDSWSRHEIKDVDYNNSDCLGLPYTHPTLDSWKWRYAIEVFDDIPATMAVGTVVRFARPVRYGLYQETSGKWYMGHEERRNNVWSTIEPVGGPFEAFAAGDNSGSGLQFRYFDSLGGRLDSTSDFTRLSRVDVYLRSDAGLAAVTERRPNHLRDSVLMRVGLRNFK